MKILIPNNTTNYTLLDSGNGQKLEQWGENIIIRTDTNCVWQPQSPSLWQQADALCEKQPEGNWNWTVKKSFSEPWDFSYVNPVLDQEIHYELHWSNNTKNIGIFPEQEANWSWMVDIIKKCDYEPNILNLFSYTGASTLAAAAAGARVCHVDSSQSIVKWARRNQGLNNLDDKPVRWIVDDALKFVSREVKRESTYDAIIMDPPAFGRDQKGKPFEFEKQIYKLLGLCKQVLNKKPLFFIFNGYSMGYSATVLKNLLLDFFPDQDIEFGELQLAEKHGQRSLPCSLFARFSATDK